MRNLLYRFGGIQNKLILLLPLVLALLIMLPSIAEAQQYTCGNMPSNPCWTPEPPEMIMLLWFLVAGIGLMFW